MGLCTSCTCIATAHIVSTMCAAGAAMCKCGFGSLACQYCHLLLPAFSHEHVTLTSAPLCCSCERSIQLWVAWNASHIESLFAQGVSYLVNDGYCCTSGWNYFQSEFVSLQMRFDLLTYSCVGYLTLSTTTHTQNCKTHSKLQRPWLLQNLPGKHQWHMTPHRKMKGN